MIMVPGILGKQDGTEPELGFLSVDSLISQ